MAKILILGAGYGGISTAVELERRDQPFTLINKHEYHYFTTLLHEAAGGRNDVEEYRVDLREILHRDTSEIRKATVQVLRPQENKCVLEDGAEVQYDTLVIALGNAPEYFGIPGMAENALLLRSLVTAQHIREHIENMVASYRDEPDPAKLRILVGGAGLTGVELCGELAEWLPELAAKYGVPHDQIELINLEAAPTLDEELRETAEGVLKSKGVQLRTGTAIVKVNPNQVELKTGEVLDARTIIWTGGVRANPLLAEAGFDVDNKGRAKVNEFLQSVDDPNVFVIGDSACFIGPDGKPLPPTGQVATQMGEVCAENIARLQKGEGLVGFHFKNLGTLASLGHDVGVGQVKNMHARGVTAGLLKEATKLKYLWKLGGLRMIAKKRGQLRRKG